MTTTEPDPKHSQTPVAHGIHKAELRWIWRLWRPFRVRLAAIITVSVISTCVMVTLPLVWKWIFDGLSTKLTEPALRSAVVLYFILGTLDWMLAISLVFARGTMNIRFEWSARQQAYERLIHQGPAFFQRFRTGDLVTRLTDDVSEKLSWFICSGIFRAFTATAVILFGILMMARLDPLLTLFTAGPLPILILLFIRTGTVLDRRFDAVQKKISDFNAGLEACFSGIRVVKAFGREEEEQRAFAVAAAGCRESEIAAARSQTLVNSLYGQVWQLGVVAVLLAGGLEVMNGRLTLGTFIAFDAYVLLLIFPMLDIGTFFVRGWQSAISIARLRELEETPPAICEPPEDRAEFRGQAPKLAAIDGRLRFDSVSFRYDGGGGREDALSDVSLEVRPGEMVAVVGSVGSGKSTLLSMIPRLVDPTGGRIELDGIDLRNRPLAIVRAAVGYVPQEAILFSESIRENIRFWRTGITDDEVLRAARIARLEGDIAIFSNGLDTKVGVRGVSLSGGQKQRVALARALAGDPAVLVLDDVTAALDAQTESSLWEELHRVLPELATIVVTHRPATLERADRIVVLDRGRVVETGTHATLARSGSHYRALYLRHQLEERVGGGDSSSPA